MPKSQRNQPRLRLQSAGFSARNTDSVIEQIYRDLAKVESRVDDVEAQSVSFTIGGKEIRSGQLSLSSGANVIPLSPTMPTPYEPLVGVRDSSGVTQEFAISSKVAGSFTITVGRACTGGYLAVQT